MKPLTLDLDEELAALDPRTALQFRQTVQSLLRLVKAGPQTSSRASFTARIAGHPAIGSWPVTMDADDYVSKLREEWDR